jgi:hypothetical protein
MEDRFENLQSIITKHLKKNQRTTVTKRIATNTGLVVVQSLITPQKIEVGRIQVPEPPGYPYARAVVADYLGSPGPYLKPLDRHYIWLPHLNLEGASGGHEAKIGETKGIFESYKAWRALRVDIDNNKFLEPYSEAANELYYSAVAMLKIIGAMAIDPSETVAVSLS